MVSISLGLHFASATLLFCVSIGIMNSSPRQFALLSLLDIGKRCRYLLRIGIRRALSCNGDLVECSPRAEGSICRDEEPVVEVNQPVLDEPPDWVRRAMPEPAHSMLENHQWDDLLAWLHANATDLVAITATSPDVSQMSKVNLLGTLGQKRPAQRQDYAHQACASFIVAAFYKAGLINMRLGKSHETALLKACSTGNFEIAALLLEHGSGQAPLCYSLVFYPECVPCREGMHCEAGDCGGEGWRLRGGARMAGRRRAGGGRRDDAEIITGDWAGGWRLWCWGVGAKEERFGCGCHDAPENCGVNLPPPQSFAISHLCVVRPRGYFQDPHFRSAIRTTPHGLQ
jgi:hypothetical protein